MSSRLQRVLVLLQKFDKLLYLVEDVDAHTPIETCCLQDPNVFARKVSRGHSIFRTLLALLAVISSKKDWQRQISNFSVNFLKAFAFFQQVEGC